MAFEVYGGLDLSFEAAADLSGKQYYGVKVDTDGKIALAGAGVFSIGVLQDKPASGKFGTVRCQGVTKLLAGGTVDEGDLVALDSAGKGVTATKTTVNTSDTGASSDAVVGSNVLGICLKGGGDGEYISVLLTHSGGSPTTAA